MIRIVFIYIYILITVFFWINTEPGDEDYCLLMSFLGGLAGIGGGSLESTSIAPHVSGKGGG